MGGITFGLQPPKIKQGTTKLRRNRKSHVPWTHKLAVPPRRHQGSPRPGNKGEHKSPETWVNFAEKRPPEPTLLWGGSLDGPGLVLQQSCSGKEQTLVSHQANFNAQKKNNSSVHGSLDERTGGARMKCILYNRARCGDTFHTEGVHDQINSVKPAQGKPVCIKCVSLPFPFLLRQRHTQKSGSENPTGEGFDFSLKKLLALK